MSNNTMTKKEKKHELLQKYVERLESSVPLTPASSRNSPPQRSKMAATMREVNKVVRQLEQETGVFPQPQPQKKEEPPPTPKKKDPEREFQFSEVSRYMRTFGENLSTKEIDDMLNEPTFERSMFSGSSIEKKDERLVSYDEFFKILTSN